MLRFNIAFLRDPDGSAKYQGLHSTRVVDIDRAVLAGMMGFFVGRRTPKGFG